MRRNCFDIPEALWELVEPILPRQVAKPQGGRPPLDNYRIFGGVLYRLRTGCQWKALPPQYGAGSTVHRHFLQWVESGVFEDIFALALRFYDDLRGIGWEWMSLDAALIKAPKGGDDTGRNPTDRGKLGTKRHILVDERGVPVAVNISAANVADNQMVEETLDSVPVMSGHRVEQGQNLCMDKGYDSKRVDEAVRDRGIEPHTRRRGEPPLLGTFKGKARRWTVERCNSWHNRFRSLLIRWDRRSGAYKASLLLGSAIIAFQQALGSL